MRGRSERIVFPYLAITGYLQFHVPRRDDLTSINIQYWPRAFSRTWESFAHEEPGWTPLGYADMAYWCDHQCKVDIHNLIHWHKRKQAFSRHPTSFRFIRRSLLLFGPSWTYWYLFSKVSFLHQSWARLIEYPSSGSRFHVHHYSGEIRRLPKILLTIKIIRWVWRGRIFYKSKLPF